VALKLTKTKSLNKDNLVKNLVLNHKLVTHLDKAIAQFDEPWTYTYEPKEKDDAWHPSGDCTPSLHELYLKATSPVERKLTVSSSKNFQVGHFFHQFLQHIVVHKLGFATMDEIERRGWRWWSDPIPPADVEDWPLNDQGGDIHKRAYRKEDLYYQRYPEQKDGRVTPEMFSLWPDGHLGICKIRPKPYHWATGSADIAPCRIPGYGECIVDFKTMNSIMFKRPYPPEGFSHKWECQVNIYMDWFDQERAIIVGVQKDNPHDMKEFEYHRNQPLIDAIYDKWELVSDCIAAGVEPPADEEHELPLMGHVA